MRALRCLHLSFQLYYCFPQGNPILHNMFWRLRGSMSALRNKCFCFRLNHSLQLLEGQQKRKERVQPFVTCHQLHGTLQGSLLISITMGMGWQWPHNSGTLVLALNTFQCHPGFAIIQKLLFQLPWFLTFKTFVNNKDNFRMNKGGC